MICMDDQRIYKKFTMQLPFFILLSSVPTMIPVVPSTPTLPTTIRLDDYKATIKLSKHHQHPSILKHIHVKVSDPQGKQIASLGALQINRAPIREDGDFLRVLDEDEQELADFSLKLFDKYGDIRSLHVDDEKLKGTGCWGRELNQGILYYVFFIDIPDETVKYTHICADYCR